MNQPQEKVALVIRNLAMGGGAERVVADFGDALTKEHIPVTNIVFFTAKEEYKTSGNYTSLWLKTGLGFFEKMFVGLTTAKKIAQITKKEKITSLITHLEEANFVGILSKVLFRNPASLAIFIHQPLSALPLWYRVVARILYPFADKIITLCEEWKNELIEEYKLDPARIIIRHNTIDIARIHSLSKMSFEKQSDEAIFHSWKKIYLTIGRLVPQKNHQFLIRAFDQFHKQHPDSKLCILGEWPLREELQKSIQSLSSKEDIHLLGNRTNPFPYYQNSHAFVFSSTSEWWSLALMEAMVCGLPVVSTIFPTGIQELFEVPPNARYPQKTKYWFLVEQWDISNYSESLSVIHSDTQLCAKISKNTQERVKDFDSNNPKIRFSELLPEKPSTFSSILWWWSKVVFGKVFFALIAYAIFPFFPTWYLFLLDDPIFYSRVAGNLHHIFELSIFPLSFCFHALETFISPWIIQRGIYWSAVFFLGYWAYSLIRRQSHVWAIFAGVFAIFNPFVLEHLIFGQVYVLWGIVCGIWSVVFLRRYFETQKTSKALMSGLCFGIAIMWTPHSIFLVWMPIGLVCLIEYIRTRFSARHLIASFGILSSWLLLNIFWILGNVFSSGLTRRAVDTIGSDQFSAFASVPWDLGIYANIALLWGFWQEAVSIYSLKYSDHFGWQLFAVLAASLILLWIITRLGSPKNASRGFDLAILIASIIAYILAIGVSGGPIISGVSHALYEHLPFYSGMREPQKWVGILLVGYVYFGGLGVGWLVEKCKKRWKYLVSGLLATLFISGFSSLSVWAFGLFQNRIVPKDFPQAWYQADALLASKLLSKNQSTYSTDCPAVKTKKTSRCYDTLFLPWHQYIVLQFQGQTILNPALNFFFRYNVLQGDNFELSEKLYSRSFLPESKMIENYIRKDGVFRNELFLSESDAKEFVATLRDLGIKSILLADPLKQIRERTWMSELTRYNLATETYINSDMTILWLTDETK